MADDPRIAAICRDYERLHSDQGNWRILWNTIAQYVLPATDNFIGQLPEGVVRTTRIFDPTAITANERFAASMEHLLTPRTQMWHDLKPQDEALDEDQETQDYCATLRKILFAARYRPGANFASQSHECYLQLGSFGNFALFVDEIPRVGIYYCSVPLSQLVWSLDASGMVDTVGRVFQFTGHQLKQMEAKRGWKLSPQIEKAAEKDQFKEFDILHWVCPNESKAYGAMGKQGMAYASCYIDYASQVELSSGGYRTFPYGIGRYLMAPREHYGRSPASVALPAIRTLNEQKKTALRAGQKMVDPPLLLAEEGALSSFSLRAGSLNPGALAADGTALVQPLEIHGNMPVAQELMQLEATAINDAFLVSLFQILVQNPDMTATEALIRAQEKGMLIAPAMGRQQSEFLGPLIVRELSILQDAGQLPPPPKQLVESGGLRVEYTSPLSKLMRAEEAQTIATSIQGLSQMAAVKPEVLDWVDWDEVPKEFLEASGFPGKLIPSPEKVQALREQRAQQQAAANIAGAAQPMSQAALNMAKTQQIAAGGGGNANAGQGGT